MKSQWLNAFPESSQCFFCQWFFKKLLLSFACASLTSKHTAFHRGIWTHKTPLSLSETVNHPTYNPTIKPTITQLPGILKEPLGLFQADRIRSKIAGAYINKNVFCGYDLKTGTKLIPHSWICFGNGIRAIDLIMDTDLSKPKARNNIWIECTRITIIVTICHIWCYWRVTSKCKNSGINDNLVGIVSLIPNFSLKSENIETLAEHTRRVNAWKNLHGTLLNVCRLIAGFYVIIRRYTDMINDRRGISRIGWNTQQANEINHPNKSIYVSARNTSICNETLCCTPYPKIRSYMSS